MPAAESSGIAPVAIGLIGVMSVGIRAAGNASVAGEPVGVGIASLGSSSLVIGMCRLENSSSARPHEGSFQPGNADFTRSTPGKRGGRPGKMESRAAIMPAARAAGSMTAAEVEAGAAEAEAEAEEVTEGIGLVVVPRLWNSIVSKAT
ncbi:hypothetical protein FGG08_000431 [Glutinoglossum americanum]|uniref:Uncharacterized protein n=1 Tax=Glutinoglossum americanum TaxID=1670608 RepID=A0A9P8L5Z5_9PEZI|nr:hypothetical protein FGG08_000431 [Glutinoglossum americanum]